MSIITHTRHYRGKILIPIGNLYVAFLFQRSSNKPTTVVKSLCNVILSSPLRHLDFQKTSLYSWSSLGTILRRLSYTSTIPHILGLNYPLITVRYISLRMYVRNNPLFLLWYHIWGVLVCRLKNALYCICCSKCMLDCSEKTGKKCIYQTKNECYFISDVSQNSSYL